MNGCLAAKVLMSHLPEITDGAYQVATEIAIEVLLVDAMNEWRKFYRDELTVKEYLGLSDEQYREWIIERRLYAGN